MGKSSKKSASKVSAPAVVAFPASTKPLKKGKRGAEDVVEKEVMGVKKQKLEEKKNVLKPEKVVESEQEPKVKVAAKNGHVELVPKKHPIATKNGHLASKKKAESSDDSESSSEDESSSDEDVAADKKAPAPLAKKNLPSAPARKDKSSDVSDSSSQDDSSDVAAAKKASPAVSQKNSEESAKKKDGTSSEESDDSEDETHSEEDATPAKKDHATPTNKASVATIIKKDDSDEDVPAKSSLKAVVKKDESSEESKSSDGSSSEEDDPKVAGVKRTSAEPKQEKKDKSSEDEGSEESDDEPQKKKIKSSGVRNVVKSREGAAGDDGSGKEESSDDDEPTKTKKPAAASKKESSAEESSDKSDEETSEEEEKHPKTPKKADIDVEMTDAATTKANVGKGFDKSPKTPGIPKEQSDGSKTLFVGNVSFSVEKADIENFFKSAGEVVDVRFAMSADNSFRGFAHVEFANISQAQKAVNELNGVELLGRPVKLDFARERGAYTPTSGDSKPFVKRLRVQGQTVFIRGFDRNDGEDQIRSSLEEHFAGCGEYGRVSIPKDPEGGVRGIAYIDFKDSNGFNQALELNGSDFGGYTLTVEEAKPRGGFSSGDGSQGSGRDFGGRSGGRGRDFGRRSGGRGREFGGRSGGRGGRFGSGGRGRGPFNKPNLAAAGTGKKTTLNDGQ